MTATRMARPGPLSTGRRLDDRWCRKPGDLVKYSSGQAALKMTAFSNWWGATNSRRDYPARDRCWPDSSSATRVSGRSPNRRCSVSMAAQFPPGFTLVHDVLRGQQRANGRRSISRGRFGSRASSQARATPLPNCYTDPVAIRAWRPSKPAPGTPPSAEWSPLTAATFAPNAVPASAANLVMAELMYHPPDATLAELGAGYNNADDFEFVRLQNIGSTPIDMAGVRFTTGITFDYTTSPLRYLVPGGNILVVANLGAFQRRYGHSCDALLAGVYGGNLANNGERLLLVDTNNVTVRDFAYDDFSPWPEAADGNGPSLLLADPASNPDHAVSANWTVSALPGGSPSGAPLPQTYAAWRALLWDPLAATNNLISGPAADPDGDGRCNFLEYAFGSDPLRASPRPSIEVFAEDVENESHLGVRIQFSAAAQEAVVVWQQSADLAYWTAAESSLGLVESSLSPAGIKTCRYRELTPLNATPTRYLRLLIAGP